MKKEELYDLIDECTRDYAPKSARDYLDEFFKSNVVIPKGENRHPYADVLHKTAEGLHYTWDTQVDQRNGFTDIHINIRAKTDEPVWEYQWLLFGKAGKTFNHCFGLEEHYLTEDETYDDVYRWVKIEETKRERKND